MASQGPVAAELPHVSRPTTENRAKAAIDLRLAYPDEVVAWRGGRPLYRRSLLADAAELAKRLPHGEAVANYCVDRYRFMVAFVAALMSDRVTLLPSDRTARTLIELAAIHPDICCVGDGDEAPSVPSLPTVHLDCDGIAMTQVAAPPFAVDPIRVVAHVFTSGSTGRPAANPKTWGTLVAKGHLFRDVLGMQPDEPVAMVATVPAQHMYGFECSILAPLMTPTAAHVGRPLLPPAVAAALASLPAPRVLATTPVHLRALVRAQQQLPEIACIISATAPLGVELAEIVERTYATRLLEIFGCTEAGIIATRRTSREEEFTCPADIWIRALGGTHFVEAHHLPGPVPITDVINLLSASSFRLKGRARDIVKIAGNRASLAGLNAILGGIDGVVDAVFFVPEDDPSGPTERLVAFVVAPGRSDQDIRRELGRRIDPTFLPRRIHLVAAIPRNETGKLTREALLALLQETTTDDT